MKILEVLPNSHLGLGLGKFQWGFWESPDEVGTSYNSSVRSVYGHFRVSLASPYPSRTWKMVCNPGVEHWLWPHSDCLLWVRANIHALLPSLEDGGAGLGRPWRQAKGHLHRAFQDPRAQWGIQWPFGAADSSPQGRGIPGRGGLVQGPGSKRNSDTGSDWGG